MESTVIVEGVVNNVVESLTKAGSTIWKYQIESYKEDGTKRFGDVKSYEDKHLKQGDAAFLLCFTTERIYKEKIYIDFQAFKNDREKVKLESLKRHFQDGQKPSTWEDRSQSLGT